MNRRDWYLKQLRHLAQATRWLARPDELALRIHQHIAKNEPTLVRAIIAGRFGSEGTSSGERWRTLALKTAIQRRKQGFPEWNPILQRSGLLLKAAVGGTLSAFPDRIEIVFKDGPAPRYKGGGKFGKQRTKRWIQNATGERVRINKKTFDLLQGERNIAGASVGKSGNLMEYADQLNQVRPFYGRPTEDEVAPVRGRGRELLAFALNAIASGQDPKL
jgi:hypothetical protein